MKRTALFAALLALPLAAFALDFSNATGHYTDAPFSKAETAGISVLTNLGAVQGNPDGTFAPQRPVNRAEFLKILFLSHPDLLVTDSDKGSCFPDVHLADWFSPYVCLAKMRNVVGGYPDGFFRPANVVNYVEALKMLSELYSAHPVMCLEEDIHGLCNTYKTYEEGAPWYQQFLDFAAQQGLLLPGGATLDEPLTRGEVARLAAGFRAWHDGELVQYRAFERGETITSSSSMSSSSSSSMSSSSSSEVSSASSSLSSASSVSSLPTVSVFPSISHFLLVGRMGPPAIDGTFVSPDEDAYLRFADVTLRREVKSVISMTLMDSAGNAIGNLVLSTDNNGDHRKWHLVMLDNTYTFKKGVPVQLGVAYTLRNRSDGGVPNELIDGIESFSVSVAGTVSNASRQLVPSNAHYPQSQTAEAHITGVTNAGSGASVVHVASNRLLARFAMTGQTVTGGILNIDSVDFTLATTNLAITNIRIGGPAAVQQSGCAVDSTVSSHVTCPILPDGFKTVGTAPAIIGLYGDVALNPGATDGSMQVLFAGRGMIGQTGSIRWSDTVGHYNWIESTAALENGTQWTVLP